MMGQGSCRANGCASLHAVTSPGVACVPVRHYRSAGHLTTLPTPRPAVAHYFNDPAGRTRLRDARLSCGLQTASPAGNRAPQALACLAVGADAPMELFDDLGVQGVEGF